MTKRRKWRILFFATIALYLIIIAALMVMIYNIPQIYTTMNKNNSEAIVTEVETALGSASGQLDEQLANIVAANEMELVVLAPGETIYSSMPVTDFSVLNQSISSSALSYQSAFIFEKDGTEYQVWLAIYQQNPQQVFEVILTVVIVGVIILCIIIIILIVVLFRNLILPFTRLRDNIFKLKEYRLNEVHGTEESSEYDLLSEELSYFTDDLKGKFDSYSVQYTSLEQELQIRQEGYQNQLQLVQSLIHDIKAPLSIEQLQIEQIGKEAGANPKLSEITEELAHNNAQLMAEIVDVLTILKNEPDGTMREAEQFNVVPVIKELLNSFRPLFKDHKVAYYLDAPKRLDVFMDPLQFKQIIHNVLSNAAKYTDDGGNFEIEVYEEHEQFVLRAYNDIADTSKIDFNRIFDLFYHVGAADKHATGIGLVTVKRIVEANNGSCSFMPFEQGVLLEVKLPLKAGDTHA
ncbi:sensor histidine kinase [Culicoidibacter larvae]|uniref:histidine kinase n=1 Tax=Culicoidibacter larvae TaxID=2579976 RepID=A0A5R8Q7L2_9FIRM|nr:HAMP domain-containing sensor histidine kinase [Culicoidibacter larvae]TLG71095.1 HAMP domain-containing histidine kinase [Culicoidibacter larvae]